MTDWTQEVPDVGDGAITKVGAAILMPQQSQTLGELSKALSIAQGQFKAVAKRGRNPAYQNSKYATLDDILEMALPILAKAGLAFTQRPVPVSDKLYLYSMLVHTSGEWMGAYYPVDYGERGSMSQRRGMGMTYARRYSTAAFLGVALDEDDDGNSVAATPPQMPAMKGNGRAAVVVPETPGMIPVPNADDELTRWRSWTEALMTVIKTSATVDVARAWAEANGMGTPPGAPYINFCAWNQKNAELVYQKVQQELQRQEGGKM